MLEINGWRGGMHAQIMETFASNDDQTAAWAFFFVKSWPFTIKLSS